MVAETVSILPIQDHGRENLIAIAFQLDNEVQSLSLRETCGPNAKKGLSSILLAIHTDWQRGGGSFQDYRKEPATLIAPE